MSDRQVTITIPEALVAPLEAEAAKRGVPLADVVEQDAIHRAIGYARMFSPGIVERVDTVERDLATASRVGITNAAQVEQLRQEIALVKAAK